MENWHRRTTTGISWGNSGIRKKYSMKSTLILTDQIPLKFRSKKILILMNILIRKGWNVDITGLTLIGQITIWKWNIVM